MNNFTVLKVLDKATKKEIYIKSHLFRPEFHANIEGEKAIPFSVYKELISYKSASFIVPHGVKKAEKPVEITTKSSVENTTENPVENTTEQPTENLVENPVEKVDNEHGIPAKMFAARKWASERGMNVTPKTTKEEIKAWANTNLPTPNGNTESA